MGGQDIDLSVDEEILKIRSPRDSVGGPYVVLNKSIDGRWAIVTLEWDGEPSLGMRWFWGSAGNPFSSGHPTWFVPPSETYSSLVSGLTLSHRSRLKVEDFLKGILSGDELQEGWGR